MFGLLTGRSRHATRPKRSHHSSKAPSRQRKIEESEDGEEVKHPDADELREARTAYYSISPEQRRRQRPSTASATSTRSRTNVQSRTSAASRSTTGSAHRHKSRMPRSSSSRSERPARETHRDSGDYVYAPRPRGEPDTATPNPVRGELERQRSERRRSRQTGSSQQARLSTVFESEVAPDDSISQAPGRALPERPKVRAEVRPSLRRSSTTSSKVVPIVERSKENSSVATSSKSSKRRSSVTGSTTSKPASLTRRHTTTSIPAPPRLVDCLTCGSDDIPSDQSAKLACGHRMCHDCLKRIFEMSVKDPAHMPPKCCTEQHIPLSHVDKIFDVKFKKLWNRKYQEYHTKNRIYCPTPKCGEWIKPSHIHTLNGRKFAKCPRCLTKVCVLCNNKMHKSGDCPKDPEIAKLVEQAKENGWQRCYSCQALVERKEGCNHMTCRCKAEFCIVCAAQWKTCNCPWFNNANIPNPDRLNDMRVPEPLQNIYRAVFRDVPQNPFFAAAPGPAQNPANGQRARPTYQDELDQRQRQEREDAEFARRLWMASILGRDDDDPAPPRLDADFREFRAAARNFWEDENVQHVANGIMNILGDAALGRRPERPPPRRRRAREAQQQPPPPPPPDGQDPVQEWLRNI